MPNFRYTARGRPHSRQRFSQRVLNFGVFCALAIFDLLATDVVPLFLAVSFRFVPDRNTAMSTLLP